jgi:hypothetical protein
MTSMTFSKYGERSEIMQLIKGDCLETKVGILMHVTKVHYFIDNKKKLVSVLRHVDETLFERKYGRIAHQIKILI